MKEIKKEKIEKDKYIYQRYNGEITKYRDDGEHYINCEIGLAFPKDDNLFLGKTSENLIDLIEEGDYVNGKYVFATENRIDDNGEKVILAENYDEWTENGIISNKDIKIILTHELYEKNCYRVGGEDE